MPKERPPERRIEEMAPEREGEHGQHDHKGGRDRGAGSLQRLRLAALLGALFVSGTGAYIYWDYARHFVSTDDAFIAARQFAIAPKVVSGYITDVPVTDNQHVSAGDVIARIDDRDYRVALEQARAQVDRRTGEHRKYRCAV